MKYPKEMYLDSGYYELDTEIANHKEKLVKCRTSHECMGGCDGIIKPGEMALYETGFIDTKRVSCYTCLNCIEQWLDDIEGK